MKKAFAWVPILIIFLAACVIGGGSWYYVNYVYSPKVSTTTTTPTDTSKVDAQKVVKQFEDLHKIKDEASVVKMFELFTPAVTQSEKDEYNSLLGKDLPTQTSRLTSTATYNYKVLSYEITSSKKTDSEYQFKVTEVRNVYSNVTGKWTESPNKKVFEIVKSSGKWLIDKYYNECSTASAGTGALKYGGFNSATCADETADWKTYTNTKYGYSIKYPSDITVEEINNNAIFKKSSGGPNPLTITISGVQNKTLDEMVQEMVKNSQTRDSQKTTLAGQPAYEGIGLGILSFYELYAIKGSYFYQLTFTSNNKDTLSELKAGLSDDQKNMLSTFKFIP